MEYEVIEVDGAIDWEDAPAAEINKFPFDKTGYKPRALARVVSDGARLSVRMEAYEEEIFAKHTQHWQDICRDSCLEFFLQPFPEQSPKYMNFEFNPLGASYISVGTDRHDLVKIAVEDIRLLNVRTAVERYPADCDADIRWYVYLTIPFKFLEKYCGIERPKSLDFMRANFYKCGEFPKKHYGCWSEVQKLDFHRPEDFGVLKLL